MRRVFALCTLGFVCLAGVNAQEVAGYGAVTGTVRDSSGEGIPECVVLLSNPALGITRAMSTTDEGVFDAPGLPPAAGYSLKVTRKGFADWQIANITVPVGQTVNFRIPLEVEAPATKVDTSSAQSPVEDTKTGVSAPVTLQQVDNLPNSGRTLDTLVLLAPAVSQDRSSGVLAFRGESFSNSMLTDGNDTTNNFYFRKPGIAPQVSEDAVQELQVLSAGWPAEFGHAMGGIVNAVTRNGTNTLHGSAYDYFHPRDWNAADRFAPGFNPADRQHQAGGSVGGPILPDRIFGFVSFEATNGDSTALNRITNPLIANAFGTAVLPSNCKASAAQCAAADNFINAQMNVPVARSLHSQAGFAKVDYRHSENHTFSVEANAMHRNAPQGAQAETVASNGGLLGTNGTYGEETRYAKAGWTGVLAPGLVNDLRAGWFHDRLATYSDANLLPSTGLLSLNVAGVPLGANPNYPGILSEQRYQLVDNVTLTSYAHTLKIGADLSKLEDWRDQLDNRYGTYNYSSLTTFAQDFSVNPLGFRNYTNFAQSFGNPITDLHSRGYHFYAQDTWKAGSRITVTAGLRWEKTHLPQPAQANPNWYQSGHIPSPNTDFAPRVGAAFLVDDKTVLRLGFGYYFEPFVGQLLDTLVADNAVYRTEMTINPVQTSSPVFPKLVSASAIPAATENVVFAASKFYNPHTLQGTAAIEHRLDKYTTVTVSYINSQGRRLWTASDLNLTAPTVSKTYTILDANGNQSSTYSPLIFTARDSTNFAHVYQIGNDGKSRYTGFAFEVRRSMSHGVTVQASYTRSTATDNISGSPILGFIPSNTHPGDYGTDQGPSALDQRNRAVVNWTWQPTLSAGGSSALRYVVNGWQVSGIATLASSLPQTPLVLVLGQQFPGTTMDYTNSLDGSGGWARAPFVGVNSLSTGSQYNVDARLTRTLQFTERLKAMLMFEAFNALNTQFNTSVNTLAYTATNGVIRPVPGAGAGNAAFGFPYGANARSAQVAFRLVW
jgi:hypothetical protein